MIVDAIIGGFVGILRGLLNLIPDWVPPAEAITDQAHTIGAMAATGNGYFPVAILGIAIVTLLGARLAIILYRVATRIWELLPLT